MMRLLNGGLAVAIAWFALALFRRPAPIEAPSISRVQGTTAPTPDYGPLAGPEAAPREDLEITLMGAVADTVFVRIGHDRFGQAAVGGGLFIEDERFGDWTLLRFDAASATFRDRAGREIVAKP